MKRFYVFSTLFDGDGDFIPSSVCFSKFSSVLDYIDSLDNQYHIKSITIKSSPSFDVNDND